MIKRVNSTGRRRIPQQSIQIEVIDGDPRTFTAVIDLADFSGPEDAEVVLEAACAGSSTIPRFPWGTVGNLTAPDDRCLRGLAGEHVFFTLKVIDRTEKFGRILGIAENIRPRNGGRKTATGRKGILPVELSGDLGDELWQVRYTAGSDVFLLINDKTPQLKDQLRSDPFVYSLIYPVVIRQILAKALSDPADEDAPDAWQTLWLNFAKQLHPARSAVSNDDGVDEQDEWIDEVVNQFCRQHDLLDKFARRASEFGWEGAS
jgi:hypothetical protein